MPLIKPDGQVEEKKVLKTGRIASQTLLKGLFVSQVRVDILKLFLLRPGREYHVRGITRRVDTEINAVRRELENLVSLGLLKKTPRRNRLYYSVKQDFPLFNEVLGMVVKEDGLGKKLSRASKSLGDIKLAFFTLPYLKGRVAGPGDLDLLVVGRVSADKIANLVKKEEKRRGHEINYSIISESDFAALKKRRDSFLLAAIFQPKVVLTPHSEQYLSVG
jgi:hypothetical protein